MNKKEFEKWVRETVGKYNADFKALCLYRGETGEIIDENKIIVLDAKTGKTGMARCHKDDKFEFEVGLAIAYARLKSWEVPKVETEPTFKRLAKRRRYWLVDTVGGKAILSADCEMNTPDDAAAFKNNNYFHSRERAWEVAGKINFLLKLERLHDTFCPDYKPDWDSFSEDKYSVFYNPVTNGYGYRLAREKIESTVYFPTEKIAQNVCAKLNKELEEEE